MTSREVKVGDRYYHCTTRSLFAVRGPNVDGEPDSWVMAIVDGTERTMFMFRNPLNRGSWLYSTETSPDFKVLVGSTWYSVGFKDLFKVVRDNANRETGPDSWEMKGEHTGKTFYMHHNQRVRGAWLHVSVEDTPEPIPVVRRSRYHRPPVI